MISTPSSMKCGMAVGLFGGLLSFFAMAFLLDVNQGKDLIANVGVYLVTAVMFFALAGGYSKTSQWNQNVLIGYSFLTLAVVAAVFIAGIIPAWFAGISIALCVISIILAMLGSTGDYLSRIKA